jgi:hypothetical protein
VKIHENCIQVKQQTNVAFLRHNATE